MTIDHKRVGRHLAYLRVREGLSQEELGTLLVPARSFTSISELERGRVRVTVELMVQFCGLFEVTPAELLHGGPGQPLPVLKRVRFQKDRELRRLRAGVGRVRDGLKTGDPAQSVLRSVELLLADLIGVPGLLPGASGANGGTGTTGPRPSVWPLEAAGRM